MRTIPWWPTVFLLVCSCAWWSAEGRMPVGDLDLEQRAHLDSIRVILHDLGIPVQEMAAGSRRLRTRWFVPDSLGWHETDGSEDFRMKLDVRLMKDGWIRVKVRSQDWHACRLDVTFGSWTDPAGDTIDRVPDEVGYFMSTTIGPAAGSGQQTFSSYAGGHIWGDSHSLRGVVAADSVLTLVAASIRITPEVSWLLVKEPLVTGPKYLGSPDLPPRN